MAEYRTIVDGSTNTAVHDVIVDSEVETTYEFDGENFVLSDRPNDVELSRETLAGNVQRIAEWYRTVLEFCSGFDPVIVADYWTVEDAADDITFQLKVDNQKVIECVYERATKTYLFKKRNERTLSEYSFRVFQQALNEILDKTPD